MNNIDGFDFSKLSLPKLDFDTSAITRQLAQQQEAMNASMNAISEHNRKKDAALFETAEASVAQKELLAQQLVEVKEQNRFLKDNYTTLKELYEMTKKEAASSAKDAKVNRIFGWVSFSVGTLIGVAGVVAGIII